MGEKERGELLSRSLWLSRDSVSRISYMRGINFFLVEEELDF